MKRLYYFLPHIPRFQRSCGRLIITGLRPSFIDLSVEYATDIAIYAHKKPPATGVPVAGVLIWVMGLIFARDYVEYELLDGDVKLNRGVGFFVVDLKPR